MKFQLKKQIIGGMAVARLANQISLDPHSSASKCDDFGSFNGSYVTCTICHQVSKMRSNGCIKSVASIIEITSSQKVRQMLLDVTHRNLLSCVKWRNYNGVIFIILAPEQPLVIVDIFYTAILGSVLLAKNGVGTCLQDRRIFQWTPILSTAWSVAIDLWPMLLTLFLLEFRQIQKVPTSPIVDLVQYFSLKQVVLT